jgi:conserved domain protein|nr:MAG TPA: major capsid protein [Caudoviricetes sp.]
MAINTIEMAKIFQTALDKQMLVGATSGWMETNASNVKYSGGDTVRMPEISTTGLAP